MAAISVYGYDSAMLAVFDSVKQDDEVQAQSEEPPLFDITHPLRPDCTTCPFLKLPLELRVQIYRYILPSTFEKPFYGVVWHRATAPLWATCHKVYSECIGMLYRDCTFDIDVKYDSVTFHHQWLNSLSSTAPPGSLISRRKYRFPDRIPARNRDLMHNFQVRIYQIDGYEGMIKYNCSNPKALALGVREQVQRLCDVLRTLPEIRELKITYASHSNEYSGLMPIALEPLQILKNTKAVSLWGFGDHIDRDFALELQTRLANAYTRYSILNLPTEIRAAIYRRVLPYSTSKVTNGIKEVQWHPGDATIMRTCRSIYQETNHLLYGLSEFEFTWMLS